MKKMIIAIDPGKSGFITIYVDGGFQFYPMPTHKVPTGETAKNGKEKTKSEFHEEGLFALALQLSRQYRGYEVDGIIEEVGGRQGWSAQNNFAFGYTAGLQKMFLIMLCKRITMVRPQKWQSEMYKDHEKIMVKSSTGKTMVHDTKATSAMVAQDLAPDIIFSKQGVLKKDGTSHEIDDNKTDSFLICLYQLRKTFNEKI